MQDFPEWPKPLDLEFLISEAKTLMLERGQAWFVPTPPIAIGTGRDRTILPPGRQLIASDRLLKWAENILKKKNEETYARIKPCLERLEKGDRWARIAIEFEEDEYRALIAAMESVDVKVFEQ